MAKRKFLGRKLRYAKKLRERWGLPIWIVLRKFGRLVSPLRIKIKRSWRREKIGL